VWSLVVVCFIFNFNSIEGLGAITRYVGNFEFWENGVKDSILQTSVSKPYDDISTRGLKHDVR